MHAMLAAVHPYLYLYDREDQYYLPASMLGGGDGAVYTVEPGRCAVGPVVPPYVLLLMDRCLHTADMAVQHEQAPACPCAVHGC